MQARTRPERDRDPGDPFGPSEASSSRISPHGPVAVVSQEGHSADVPLWFGAADRSLFAMATVPDGGRASGAVVLCQPLGIEGECTHRTFAMLSAGLADAGILAIRFDYDGTRDSVGSHADSDRVQAWVGAVRQAVDLARRSGVSKVAVLGMRLGATLAAAAASDADGGIGDLLDALVLWDPYASGRAFLRAQRTLQLVLFSQNVAGEASTEPAETLSEGSVEIPGVVFGADTVSAMDSLDLAKVEGPLASKILVLAREVQPQGAKAIERFVAGHSAERWEVRGQEELVDARPDKAQVPVSDVKAVTAWLADVLAGERTEVSIPRRDEAVVDVGATGPIVERTVSLGPSGLFGIMTEPGEAGRGDLTAGPTVIFLNTGVSDHTGPVRLWVDLGRRWAQRGLRSVRVDISGLGYSPARPGSPFDVDSPPEALDDVLDIAAAVSPDDPTNVVFVGLCSGGYHAIEAGLALKVRGVCAINPILHWKPAEIRAEGVTTDQRRQAAPVRKRWVRALPAHDTLGPLVERMPDPVWWLVNRFAVERSPARAMRQLVERGVRTFVVSGEWERQVMWRGERRAYREITSMDGFQQVVAPTIDHVLYQRDAREMVSQVVSDDTLLAYAPRQVSAES
jgi:pimeloyl-ACP methyl ester carboxylesterase